MSGLPTGFIEPCEGDLSVLDQLCQTAKSSALPDGASRIESGIPIYLAESMASQIAGQARRQLLQEWASVLMDGAGVFVVKGLISEVTLIDDINGVFADIIRSEQTGSQAGSDHFAEAGSNVRVWNAHQKLCLSAPDLFVRYHANPVFDAMCEAWLGPAYQVTAQVNLVRPGSAAQTGHRDYHLGFMSMEQAAQYPAQVHSISPCLTLQGAIAHCDMPIESGPTRLLPHSQKYLPGYLSINLESFKQYFEENAVQLPLEKGDALFFNPALFHAAGSNQTQNCDRMANLFQISSAFGRAMESLDRVAMCQAIYPELREQQAQWSEAELAACIAACAEGYAFPGNLDRDFPATSKAPSSQAEILWQGLRSGWSVEQLSQTLGEQWRRRQP